MREVEGERLVLSSSSCYFFFSFTELREVALSCWVCWIDIAVILTEASLVVYNSSAGKSGFVAKLARNISDFNSLVSLLELKKRLPRECGR